MEQEERLKSVVPTRTGKEHQEIGVCGTGKHRVININPLLLTPASASKIRPGANEKKSSKITRKRKNNLGSRRSLSSNNVSPPSRVSDHKTGFWVASLPHDKSALDDSSSVADSEFTDISEFSFASGVGNSAPYVETKGSSSELNVLATEGSNKISVQADRSQVNTTARPFHRLESRKGRVIEISPSLMLPVTAMPSNALYDFDTSSKHDAADSQNPRLIDATSLSSSRTSLSDLTSLRQSVTDTDAISTFSEQDSSVPAPIENMAELQAECERLREALRLADADIAILVSSKQQLQLDFHNEEEKVKMLTRIVFENDEKCREHETTIAQLQSSLRDQRERLDTEIDGYRGQIQVSKSEMTTMQNTLDLTLAEKDAKALEIEHLKQNLETSKAQLDRFNTEVQEFTRKNVQLEGLIEQASMKDEGTESFIKHVMQEKKEVAAKLQEKENENTIMRIANKTLEARIVDLQHMNQGLAERSAKYEARFREIDSENVTLGSRLQAATKEKSDLNAAVLRLRSDLAKVENTFARLKQQMIEKSNLAEKESTRRTELEERVKSLLLQVAKLNNVNAETRIRDKNVQIEQLLTKSKMSTTEKTKLEKRVEKLQEHIASNEKSWVEAIEREKQSSRFLCEKDDLIALKSREISRLSSVVESEQQKTEQVALSFKESKEEILQLKDKLSDSENAIEKITREKNSVSEMVKKLRNQLHFENDKLKSKETQHEEETTRLQSKIQHLNDEVDALQKAVVSKEKDINALSDQGKTFEKQNEDHSIHQLELLSELQSARRELSHERDSLLHENNKMKLDIETATREIREWGRKLEDETQKHKEEIESFKQIAETAKKSLEQDILTLEMKSKDVEKSKLRLDEEMSIIKDHNNVLSQQLGTLQIHNGKLAEELRQKIQENEELSSLRLTEKEELETLKQELASVTLQLTNVLQENEKKDENRVVDIENLLKERELLRSAVIRQQEYCVSLQKHYEKWAKDATFKMRAETARFKRSLIERRKNIANENSALFEKHNEVVNANGQPNSWLSSGDRTDTPIRSEDVLSQSIQDEKDLQDALHSDTGVAQRRKSAGGNRPIVTAKQSVASFTQTEHDAMLCSACEHVKNKVPEKVDYSTQTDHNSDYVNENQVDFNKESPETDFLIEEKLRLMEENTQQAEMIAVLEERIQNWSMSDGFAALEDTSTQTSHDDDFLPMPTDTISKLSPLLEDSSTQTDHEGELAGHTSAAQLEEEILTLKEFSDRRIAELQQQNTILRNSAEQLQKSLSDLTTKVTFQSSTQTDHESEQVSRVVAPTPILQSAFTQTDHNMDLASPAFEQQFNNVAMHTKVSVVSKDTSTQTDHNMELASAALNQQLTSDAMPIKVSVVSEDSSTQTDHDLVSIVSPGLPKHISYDSPVAIEHTAPPNPINTQPHSTQTEHDLDPAFSARIKPPVLESLSTQTADNLDPGDVKPRQTTSSTQTDSEALVTRAPTTHACVATSTQTDHDDEVLVHFGSGITQSDWEQLQEENGKLKIELVLAMDALQDLKASQTNMLEDSGTQTSHDELPVASASPVHDRHEVSTTLLEDSCTQTDREMDTVFPGNKDSTPLIEELELARDEVRSLSHRLRDVVTENGRLNASLLEHEELKTATKDFSSQTSHEEDFMTPSPTVPRPSFSVTVEASCQTEHNLQPVGSGSVETGDAYHNNEQDAFGRAFDLSTQPESSDLPSPMQILHTMESKKLKAYKKTVHLLKKKLESAEERIANLQLELKVLTETMSGASGESENTSSSKTNTDALKTVEQELYQTKKAAALQAEETRRKTLAERKILESKVSNMSDRILGLTDTNGQLRKSVQVLQVKLTEKSRQGDVALKEKTRYQMRARRLQASLRSLAWITGNQDKNLSGMSEDLIDGSFGDNSLISEAISEDVEITARGDSAQANHSSSLKPANLPASVVEIEASLKDLQSEIIALEKQMQEHNSAVNRSKSQWTRLKEESRVISSPSPVHHQKNVDVVDPFSKFSEVV